MRAGEGISIPGPAPRQGFHVRISALEGSVRKRSIDTHKSSSPTKPPGPYDFPASDEPRWIDLVAHCGNKPGREILRFDFHSPLHAPPNAIAITNAHFWTLAFQLFGNETKR